MSPRLIALYFTVLLASLGCNTVTVLQPLGEEDPTAYKALEGTWINDDGKMLQTHLSTLGQFAVGSLEWDEAKDQFKAETLHVRATRAGKLRLLQVESDPTSSNKRFAFG